MFSNSDVCSTVRLSSGRSRSTVPWFLNHWRPRRCLRDGNVPDRYHASGLPGTRFWKIRASAMMFSKTGNRPREVEFSDDEEVA